MGDLTGRYAAFTERVVDRVLAPAAHTASAVRRAVLDRAARLGGRAAAQAGGEAGHDLAPALAGYVDTVARHAHQVTDEDVAALQRAGNSDDTLFEVTVAAALGAALGRLERGLAALRG
jgi:alkylhydroperoxidase family enzyme